jgi:hypothetical protein
MIQNIGDEAEEERDQVKNRGNIAQKEEAAEETEDEDAPKPDGEGDGESEEEEEEQDEAEGDDEEDDAAEDSDRDSQADMVRDLESQAAGGVDADSPVHTDVVPPDRELYDIPESPKPNDWPDEVEVTVPRRWLTAEDVTSLREKKDLELPPLKVKVGPYDGQNDNGPVLLYSTAAGITDARERKAFDQPEWREERALEDRVFLPDFQRIPDLAVRRVQEDETGNARAVLLTDGGTVVAGRAGHCGGLRLPPVAYRADATYSPELFPQLAYDEMKGGLTIQTSDPITGLLVNTIPQSAIALEILGAKDDYAKLKAKNPAAAARMIASQAGLPILMRTYNPDQKRISEELARQEAQTKEKQTALKSGDLDKIITDPRFAETAAKLAELQASGQLDSYRPNVYRPSTRQLITGALGGQAGFSPITPAEQDAYAEQVAVLNATPGNSRVTS